MQEYKDCFTVYNSNLTCRLFKNLTYNLMCSKILENCIFKIVCNYTIFFIFSFTCFIWFYNDLLWLSHSVCQSMEVGGA